MKWALALRAMILALALAVPQPAQSDSTARSICPQRCARTGVSCNG